MVAASTMEPRTSLRKQLEEADPDLLRELVRSFAEALMAAELDVLNEAGYGERASGARIAATGAGADWNSVSARSSSRCPSSARTRTSRSGLVARGLTGVELVLATVTHSAGCHASGRNKPSPRQFRRLYRPQICLMNPLSSNSLTSVRSMNCSGCAVFAAGLLSATFPMTTINPSLLG